MNTDLKTQLEERLKAVEPNITGKDKSDGCKELDISRPTLDKYLNGEVFNVETGLKILEFFNRKIDRRIVRLKKLSRA